jgi:hypothetical protein
MAYTAARAYRIRRLASAEERQQFLESCRMLEAIRDEEFEREPGADHVFRLREVGLSSKNVDDAVQVFRWIEGDDLGGPT